MAKALAERKSDDHLTDPTVLKRLAHQDMEISLQAVATALVGMRESLGRMPKLVQPQVFYHKIRPYLAGWKDNPSLPQGVFYQVRLCDMAITATLSSASDAYL